MITEEQVNEAYHDLIHAKTNYERVGQKVIDAKNRLEKAKLAGLAAGTIEGRNAELREASAREQLAELYDALDGYEALERQEKLEMDVAYLEVERIRLLVRLEELEAKDGVQTTES